MRARVVVRDIRKGVQKIEALSRAGEEQFVSGLRVIGEVVATDVKASRPGAGIPVDTGYSPSTGKPTGRTGGTLRASVFVLGPERRGILDVVQLVAGGAAVKYALRQHEELQWKHNIGESRYFPRALERWLAGGNAEDAYREMMAAAVKAVA